MLSNDLPASAILTLTSVSVVVDIGDGESVQAENQRWHSPEEAAAEAAEAEPP